MRQADLIVVKWRPQSVQDLISLGESKKRCSGKNKKNIFWRIMLSVAFFKNIVIWRFIFWQMNATVHVSQAYNHKVQHFNSKLYYYPYNGNCFQCKPTIFYENGIIYFYEAWYIIVLHRFKHKYKMWKKSQRQEQCDLSTW